MCYLFSINTLSLLAQCPRYFQIRETRFPSSVGGPRYLLLTGENTLFILQQSSETFVELFSQAQGFNR